MAIDNFTGSGFRPLPYPLSIKGGYGSATLAADLQLTSKSSQWLALDPGGAARNVDLPGPGENLTDNDGRFYWILNTADAAENLVVRNPAGATVVTISQNERALVVGTGSDAWAHMGIETIALT